MIVENKPGAGGTIAMADVAHAPPDGYTIGFASQGTLVFNQALYSKPGYDSLKDFAPISFVGGVSNVMIVPPTSPAKRASDIVAEARAHPGKLTFSSGGSGTSHHLSGVLFGQLTHVELLHVPYKGAPQGILTVMIAGAFFGSMPAGGGTSQSAVVRAAGGRSQNASLVTAAAAVATMLLLAPLLALMPHATLAAVVIVYSVGLIQPAEFVAIRRVRTMEFRWAVIACVGVLLFGTLDGIIVAIVASMIGLASQVTNPRVSVIVRKRGADVLRPLSSEHPDDESVEGLLILRPEGRLFFVNAQNVSDQISALIRQYEPRVVALDMSRVTDIEYSALQALLEAKGAPPSAGSRCGSRG